MARGRGGSKGYGKGKTWTRPDPGDRFPKFSLAPYGMSNGSPFYLQGLEEKKVLSLKHIAESRLPRNSEAVCLRLGLQLSESASTMEMGAETLAQLAENDPSTNHWKCFADMAEYFATSKGQDTVAAAKVLNKGNGGPKDEDEMSGAIGKWLKGLDRLLQKEKSVRKMAQISARMYLWSMDTLEQLAMYQHPDVFFGHIDDNNELLAIHALEKLAKAPAVKTLRKAMEAAYNKQILSKTAVKGKDALSTSEASDRGPTRGRKRKARSTSESCQSSSAKGRGGRSAKKPKRDEKSDASSDEKPSRRGRRPDKTKTRSKDRKNRTDAARRDKQLKKKEKKERAEEKKKRHCSKTSSASEKESPKSSKKEDKWSEASSDGDTDAFTTWGGVPIQAFLDALGDGARARKERSKPNRLQLSGLLQIVNMIPVELLKPYKLDTVVTMLQKMERMPRQEKVDEIFSLLDVLAEAAASHLPEDRPEDREAPPLPDAAAEAAVADGEAAAAGAPPPGES